MNKRKNKDKNKNTNEDKRMKQGKKNNQDRKMIYTIAAIFIMLFALLIGYMVYFTIFKQKQMAVHPQNTRLNSLESEVIRGNIYDTTTKELLATTTEDGERYYPYKSLYAHPIGYAQSGKTGVEALANQQLLYPSYDIISLIKAVFMNKKFKGRDVVLTLDHRYQEAVARGMEGKRGGVVVMEATTGKIRAMYSTPHFDPNKIVENWSKLNTDTEDTPLVNRATKGLYPPGSIFKIVTTLAYMQTHPGETLDFTHDCTGSISGTDYTIKCYNQAVHGELGLTEAFAKSCNTYFIALAESLPAGALKAAAESVGYNGPLNFDMDYSMSRFSLNEKGSTLATSQDKAGATNTSDVISSDFEKAATAIGQGKTLTSPLHMAILASAIINDGVSMKPYLIEYSMTKTGTIKLNNRPKQTGALMTEEQAKMLQELMENVVDHGTAVSLPEKGLIVGGKTGTAQNETEDDHSWFMGYAKDPNGNKAPIAFAVVVEGGGKGAQALKVCDQILQAYRNSEE